MFYRRDNECGQCLVEASLAVFYQQTCGVSIHDIRGVHGAAPPAENPKKVSQVTLSCPCWLDSWTLKLVINSSRILIVQGWGLQVVKKQGWGLQDENSCRIAQVLARCAMFCNFFRDEMLL